MDKDKALDVRSIAFVNTVSKQENFVRKCKGVVLSASADCHVDFDDTPADTGAFFIKANVAPFFLEGEFTKLNVIGNSGSGTLYIIGVR